MHCPFIGHSTKKFSERFPESSLSMFNGYKLHLSKVSQVTSAEAKAIEDLYGEDLPNNMTFAAEVDQLDALTFTDKESGWCFNLC